MNTDPEIGYCQTADGVNIAYAVSGAPDGEPLVYLSPLLGHLTADWNFPHERSRFEWFGRTHRVIRFDVRGSGLSQRQGFAAYDYQADLLAVVDHLSLSPFVICTRGTSGPQAITFAASHPERVRGLLLMNTFAYFAALSSHPVMSALEPLVTSDWTTYTEAYSRVIGCWEDGADARRYAAVFRESTSPENYLAYRAYVATLDARPLLARVTSPTLIVHNNGGVVPIAEAQQLAAGIPNAQIRYIDRTSMFYDLAAPDVGPLIEDFLGVESAAGVPAPDPVAQIRGTAIILFADIVESTATTERVGDAAFRDRARTLDDRLRTIIRERGGTPIDGKLLGDGVLATFPSASEAIAAALAFEAAAASSDLQLHVGLHAGDVIREANNVFGGAVNIAARISALSAPGEVLVSDVVRALARTSAGVEFEDRGEHALKGISEPQRVFAVNALTSP